MSELLFSTLVSAPRADERERNLRIWLTQSTSIQGDWRGHAQSRVVVALMMLGEVGVSEDRPCARRTNRQR